MSSTLPRRQLFIHSLLFGRPSSVYRIPSHGTSTFLFEFQAFLGQGSFGFVTMVCKKEGAMEGDLFALKSLSKLGVVEGGQVQHIKDEKSVSYPVQHTVQQISASEFSLVQMDQNVRYY